MDSALPPPTFLPRLLNVLPFRTFLIWVAILNLSFAFPSNALPEASAESQVPIPSSIDFVKDVRPIFQKHCYSCHGPSKQKSGLRLDVKSAALRGGDTWGDTIVPYRPDASQLITAITSDEKEERMPPEGMRLSASEIETLTQWIAQGAIWPDGVDETTIEDPRSHWSFQKIVRPSPPGIASESPSSFLRNDIDTFILEKLLQKGLKPTQEANRTQWIRRVYFDLIGIPPTPQQVSAFLEDARDDAYDAVVDELLASPRYGERWAQHWLDVVRYADTHGFEVNTERPNAWPYRDYVIEAFNKDTPYDQFVREQLAGDSLETDAATGFLVTSSVLLPGQIGADDISKRLARQDAIDEIVVNTGQTFLGLSIGCARCHDHKFDPIPSKDYYAMQTFFAGVEYLDRPLNTPEAKAKRQEIEEHRKRIVAIEQELSSYQPLAIPTVNSPKQEIKADINEEILPKEIEARFIRFTIHDANLHPSLGLLEPCIDELEAWTKGSKDSPERNVALASLGTKATASGSQTSDRHQLKHINDGQYGNDRSWMSEAKGRGWVQLELPKPELISKIVWGRDRLGMFSDRLAIAYTIEAGLSLNSLQTIAQVSPKRSMVNAKMNIDRIASMVARRLRFTIRATNSLEPCIDELEVFDVSGKNVAAAKSGATVQASGSNITPDRHELPFVNDGIYGNSRSWMSSETGKGVLEVSFSQACKIDRIVWGRDREGVYSDRMATEYSIEALDENGQWRLVADSSDRVPYSVEKKEPSNFSTQGLSPEEALKADELINEKRNLEDRINAATQAQLAFVGSFRKPDTIHVLHRGDPEQPKEPVSPATLSVLDGPKWSHDMPEAQRRLELASWITSPSNPLTSRVMVNRIWQGHFGIGLVETSSDFGKMGAKPSHPELLDWLASQFVEDGWSMKKLHRLIVLSGTYRQGTQPNPQGLSIDADSRFLWRYPPHRLEAESIRDSILAINGRLSLKMGGRGFDLFDKRGGLSGFIPVESFQGEGLRRMIYAHKVRRERDAVFGAFDCPDAGQSTARRRDSTTPIQALNLFNSTFTLEQSDALAIRLKNTHGDRVDDQVQGAYQSVLSRTATTQELEQASEVVAQHGLGTLCRVLFNCNEFLFVP